MTRLQEAIGLGLVLGVIHGLVQPAYSVPVVPNFTQGSMTSHTETTSKVTETINSIDYSTGWQYSVTGNNVSNNGQPLNPNTNTSTVVVNPLGGIEGQVTSPNSSLSLNGQNFTISNPGAAFQFTQSYKGPCLLYTSPSPRDRG